MKTYIVGLVALLMIGLIVDHFRLANTLTVERYTHERTRNDRDAWRFAAKELEQSALALEKALDECYERQKKATVNARKRKEIMQQVKNKPAKIGEVDDATRNRAVQHLNRPL